MSLAFCGALLYGHGYSENLPGKPQSYAESAEECCAFCHATPGCHYWTWNGQPPGNGQCYAKASNKTGGHSATMISGGGRAGPIPPPPPIEVKLVSAQVLTVTEPTYASWNIDSSCNRGFHRIHFANKNLLAAGRGLAPSVLRFGGSGNDYLTYGLSAGSPECASLPTNQSCSYFTPGCLNATHWASLYEFAKGSGAHVLFGISFGLDQACKEHGAYKWDSSNAQSLLTHLQEHKQTVFGFELGNEINNHGGPPCNLTAAQQADALHALSKMVQTTQLGAMLVGPDTGYRQAQDWLTDYLPRAAPQLHAVTHHVYPGISRRSFNHPQELDRTLPEITWYTKLTKQFAPKAQVWAGEDGPVGGGNDGTCGSSSVCATFASALWYADDLANRAKHGFVQYQRQTLIGGAYGLTSSERPHPQSALGATEAVLLRPGYWTNYLYKRLVGSSVLNASSSDPFIRAYAFRGTPPSEHAALECAGDGRLQLLLINLYNSTNATVTLPRVVALSYSAWTLTPPLATTAGRGVQSTAALDPFSTRVRLNGQILPEKVDGPALFLEKIPVPPSVAPVQTGMTLPPLSMSFVCF